MYKHPWEYMEKTIKYMAEIKIIGAGPHSMTAIHSFAPTLWVDFLNSNPKNKKSIWSVYKKYTQSIRELEKWMTDHKYPLAQEAEWPELLSKEDFLNWYPLESREDAENLHQGVQETLDSRREILLPLSHYMVTAGSQFEGSHEEEYREYLAILTKGAKISLPRYTYTFTFTKSSETPDYPYKLELNIPSSSDSNFWLSVIVGGMFLCYMEQPNAFVRRCASPDCQKYFIPASGLIQQYHSKTCQKRHYMRIYREDKNTKN